MTMTPPKPATPHPPPPALRTRTDKATRPAGRPPPNPPRGAPLGYLRPPRHPPPPRRPMNAQVDRHFALLDPESGEFQTLPDVAGKFLQLRKSDGRMWTCNHQTREIMAYDLPSARQTLVGRVPAEVLGHVSDISFDGRTVILLD